MEPVDCVQTSCLTQFDLLFSGGFPLFQRSIFSAQDVKNISEKPVFVNKMYQILVANYPKYS